MGLTIINNIAKFLVQNERALDRALNRMAVDIERLSKVRVPVDKGQLKSSGKHVKVGPLHYRTEFNKEYAAYQEFGGDGKRIVRNYTTPGTGAHYLKNSGDQIKKNAWGYIKAEVNRIKI